MRSRMWIAETIEERNKAEEDGRRASSRRCRAAFSVVLGLAISAPLARTHGQPADEQPAWTPSAGPNEDAAARGLSSLYVAGGLTAEQAVSETIQTSPSLRRTRALALEAEGGALQAISALAPRFEVSARATKLNPVETGGISPEGAQTPDLVGMVQDPAAQTLWQGLTEFQFPALTDQYSLDATLSYSFTDSLAEALPAYRAAQRNEEAAEQQLEAELNNVALDARRAYYEFARATGGLAVAQSAVDAAEAQREETAAQVNVGTAARVDLLRVEAQLEAANVSLERARFGLEVSQRALQTLMHTEVVPTLGEDLAEPVAGLPLGREDELKERAYRDRPDLKALYTYVEATRHELRSANGGRIPDLLLLGSAQYANPNLRIVPQRQTFEGNWEVSAVIRWSPNDTVEAQGRSKKLRAALKQAYADVTTLSDAIRVEVAEGYHGVRTAKAAMKSATLGLSAAEEGYRVKREQLRAGTVNTTELLQAQADLIRAQVDVVDSAVDLRIAKAELRRAIGTKP